MSYKLGVLPIVTQKKRLSRATRDVEFPLKKECHVILFRGSIDYGHDPIMTSWLNSLSGLLDATGFIRTIAARNINDEQEVIVITNWVDAASLRAFTLSAGYTSYFEALGINYSSTPNAFFTLEPSGRGTFYLGKVTIYTLHFKHPVDPKTRTMCNRAHGFNTYQAWYSEPQLSVNGDLTDTGVLIQCWPTDASNPTRDLHDFTSNDSMARKRWQKEVDQIKPLQIEEVTWDFTPPADEEDDIEEEENSDDGDA